MKKFIVSVIVFFLWILLLHNTVDAKVLPRFAGNSNKISAPQSTFQYVSAKLRADRKALLVTFSNLQSLKSLDYTLTYNGSGADQGINGSVDISAGSSASRTLVFGTESKGVYTYHTNIKNMKFVVTIVPKSGKTIIKKYVVKP